MQVQELDAELSDWHSPNRLPLDFFFHKTQISHCLKQILLVLNPLVFFTFASLCQNLKAFITI